MDVNRGPREGTGHIPDTTGVVEVDVRYGYPGQVIGAQPMLGKRLEHYRDGALAPRLDQHGRRALDQVAGCHPFPAAQQRVDLEHAGHYVPAHGRKLAAKF